MSETEYQNSPVFNFPKKPDVGSNGYTLQLKANYFPLTIQISKVFHYDVTVIPERCSRKICYEVIKTMINSYKNTFGDLKPVYDGKKNMYTRNLLHAKDVYIMEFDVTLPGTSVKEDRFFKVILKYHSEIDLKVLNNSLNPNLGYPIPDDCLQALDAIIRYSPSLKYTMIGRSFLSPSTEACGNLGGGREIWFGFYQSVQPSYWKVMLNIDVCAFC